jgi:hypothetical protein
MGAAMKTSFAILVLGLSVAAPACIAEVDENVGSLQQEAKGKIMCGGFAGLTCPGGMICVDDPSDDCDPDLGGADCIGMCRKGGGPKKPPSCKGQNDKSYIAYGEDCWVVKFFCEEGFQPFFDDCGCGCEPVAGEPCGANTCADGEYCCNPSCGICAPEGGFCTQQVCTTE